MERIAPRRRRGGRRKGERRFVMLGMSALFELYETRDIDVVLAKLAEVGIRPHVSGWGERRSFTVCDYQFPEAMRERVCEVASHHDGWGDALDRPKE
jgi:hypothetical protein